MPAYFYPLGSGTNSGNGYWSRLTESARSGGVQIVAIFGPAIGPGKTVDANYTRVVNALRAAGGRVLGYVPSGYAGNTTPATSSSCKPVAPRTKYSAQDVIDCASGYKTLYNVDGIFVDEMGVTGGASEATGIAFYQSVYNGIKALNGSWLVVGNPGTAIGEGYLRNGVSGGADVLILFEAGASSYASISPPTYVSKYPTAPFGALLHTAPSGFNLSSAISLTKARNMSYIYITDDPLTPNPWDTLPTNWETFVATVRTSNTP